MSEQIKCTPNVVRLLLEGKCDFDIIWRSIYPWSSIIIFVISTKYESSLVMIYLEHKIQDLILLNRPPAVIGPPWSIPFRRSICAAFMENVICIWYFGRNLGEIMVFTSYLYRNSDLHRNRKLGTSRFHTNMEANVLLQKSIQELEIKHLSVIWMNLRLTRSQKAES